MKYRITVEMTTEDYYLIKSKAKAAVISVREFSRGCIRFGSVRERLVKKRNDHIHKLCGMTNNLNQLAFKANAEGYTTQPYDLV